MTFLIGDMTSTASEGSLVQNNYDTIEGGGFIGKKLP